MVSERYYRILSLQPGCDTDEARHAYHAMAKRNHPDLFPENERDSYRLRMMEINEAYMAVLQDIQERAESSAKTKDPPGARDPGRPGARASGSTDAARTGPNPSGSRETVFSRGTQKADPGTAVAGLKDPAYVYYKLGFRFFTDGRRAFNSRFLRANRRLSFRNKTSDVLKFAIVSLNLFHRAYGNFLRVTKDYPDSVWARDAALKLYYLDRYNVIYQRICENMSRQIRQKENPEKSD